MAWEQLAQILDWLGSQRINGNLKFLVDLLVIYIDFLVRDDLLG